MKQQKEARAFWGVGCGVWGAGCGVRGCADAPRQYHMGLTRCVRVTHRVTNRCLTALRRARTHVYYLLKRFQDSRIPTITGRTGEREKPNLKKVN